MGIEMGTFELMEVIVVVVGEKKPESNKPDEFILGVKRGTGEG